MDNGTEVMPVPPVTAPAWHGSFESYVVGEAGRAASRVVPVPDPAEWEQRDTVLDAVALLEGKERIAELRAASLRGLSHRSFGKVRQDEYGYRRTTDGRYLVICVADGVGSGRLSHKAAKFVTTWGVKWLAGLLASMTPHEIDWGDFVRKVAMRLEERARRLLGAEAEGKQLREVAELMATTVLYAVFDLHAVDGAHPVHLVSVGDTSAWVLRNGVWEPQAAVKNDGAEVYSSSVQALPMMPATDPVAKQTTVRAGEALVLMTDGIGDPLGHGTGEVGRFLAEVWATPPASGLEFAAHAGFARRTFDDDRTAVAVWPVAGA